jgi:hypothetical protein
MLLKVQHVSTPVGSSSGALSSLVFSVSYSRFYNIFLIITFFHSKHFKINLETIYIDKTVHHSQDVLMILILKIIRD